MLARRYKLPRRIQDFIAEHQGTGLVRFFYAEAQKAAGDTPVDDKPFRYPGPRPRSRETALVMLADTCESAVRAARPETREQIDEIVRKMFNQRLIEGELAESDSDPPRPRDDPAYLRAFPSGRPSSPPRLPRDQATPTRKCIIR